MSIKLYMDEHIPGAVTRSLRSRGADVLTAQEDGRSGTPDPELLDRAMALRRVLVTADRDFLIETARRQRASELFGGVIYAPQSQVSSQECVNWLELMAGATDYAEYEGHVEYLPTQK